MQVQLSYDSEERGKKQKQDDRNDRQYDSIYHTSGLDVLFSCLDQREAEEVGGRSNTIWFGLTKLGEGREKGEREEEKLSKRKGLSPQII